MNVAAKGSADSDVAGAQNDEESLLKKVQLSSHSKQNVSTHLLSNHPSAICTDTIDNLDHGFGNSIHKERLGNGNGFHTRPSTYRRQNSPLSELYCSGQRVEFRGEKAFSAQNVTETITTNSKAPLRQKETHSVALNKLYSSLKRLKCRHEAILKEDVHMRCSSFPFNSSRNFGNSRLPNNDVHSEEDIFILLGGKSKPVRFEVNPENIHLLESEFAINLKSKTHSNLDKEDFELLKRFRDKYRSGQNGCASPCLPWSRHAVSRTSNNPKDNSVQQRSMNQPSATYDIEEEDFGRKLSIHVYLPNIFPGNTAAES